MSVVWAIIFEFGQIVLNFFSRSIDLGHFLSNVNQGLSDKDLEAGWHLIEDF
jgi:hypothetical protein